MNAFKNLNEESHHAVSVLMKYGAAVCYVKSTTLQDCTARLEKKTTQKTNRVSLTLFSDGVIGKSEPADGVG